MNSKQILGVIMFTSFVLSISGYVDVLSSSFASKPQKEAFVQKKQNPWKKEEESWPRTCPTVVW
jgi:hypothetical protein